MGHSHHGTATARQIAGRIRTLSNTENAVFTFTLETAYNGSVGTEHFHPLQAISGIVEAMSHYTGGLNRKMFSV